MAQKPQIFTNVGKPGKQGIPKLVEPNPVPKKRLGNTLLKFLPKRGETPFFNSEEELGSSFLELERNLYL